MLRYLIRHEGKPVSRKAMLEEVWGLREDTDTRAIDNFIVRLRRYIEDDAKNPRHLLTVRAWDTGSWPIHRLTLRASNFSAAAGKALCDGFKRCQSGERGGPGTQDVILFGKSVHGRGLIWLVNNQPEQLFHKIGVTS